MLQIVVSMDLKSSLVLSMRVKIKTPYLKNSVPFSSTVVFEG
jgi:hypothetical protein